MKRARVALFALAAAVLLVVPLTQILRYEGALASGNEYRFRCEPVDPYAPFSGRYVAVRVTDRRAPAPPGWRQGDRMQGWAHLEVASDGFAFLAQFSKRPPADGDFLRAIAYSDWADESQVRLRLGVNRYYVTESIAADAEQAFASAAREGHCVVVLRAAGGVAVPVALLLNNEPIEALLKRSR